MWGHLGMPARGFCQHGKVWTTCPICGREVIAAATKRGGGRWDEFEPVRARPKKKPAVAGEEEAGAEAEPTEEDA